MTTMQALWQTFFTDEAKDPAPKSAKRARTVPPNHEAFPHMAPLAPRPPEAAAGHSSGWDNNNSVIPLAPLMPAPTSSMVLPVYPPPSSTNHETKQKRTEHRKRKNAEYARNTRERKRNQELLLNLELASLERENERLKNMVKTNIPDKAQAIIADCCYKDREQSACLTPFHAKPQDSSKLVKSDFELIESLSKTRQSFVLTDPHLPDNPIVYASRPFLTLTGYTREQVLGRNCRFLQGIDTDPEAVAEIRKAIAAGTDGAACLLNYKADGTSFWNQFFVAPLHDKNNQVVNYVSNSIPMQMCVAVLLFG